MFAYGAAALILGIYLWMKGHKGTQIGTFLTLTLLGDAVISWTLTLVADKIGRRRVIVIGSLLMVLAGSVFASTDKYPLLLIAAIVGVISPGAHEVGPFRAVQESILAQLTPIEARTDIYAWFAVMSTGGMAIGLSVGGWITRLLHDERGWERKDTYPIVFAVYAGIGLLKVGIALLLTEKSEPDYALEPENNQRSQEEAAAPLLYQTGDNRATAPKRPVKGTAKLRRVWQTVSIKMSADSRRTLIRLCILFAINSFASAMLPGT